MLSCTLLSIEYYLTSCLFAFLRSLFLAFISLIFNISRGINPNAVETLWEIIGNSKQGPINHHRQEPDSANHQTNTQVPRKLVC